MASTLIAVISPAKLLDDHSRYPQFKTTTCDFLQEAEQLMKKLKKLKPKEIGELMDLSDKLSKDNFDRYQQWGLPFTSKNALPAVHMFKGDVYRGLAAHELSDKDLYWSQDHIRILSGVYGLLRPMDLIQPYRLMMGTPFGVSGELSNLYKFWGSKLAEKLNDEISPKGTLINLASSEYFKAVQLTALKRKVVHCEFKEKKAGGYSVVSVYAKIARGRMARFIIDRKIKKHEDLKAFDVDGYRFNPSLSTESEYVFTRG